ncbi:MAG: FtsX-like permease family protein, partial [Magnetococcales bacterium]|nr:FtsX-like permease family protein [Magnetococcales bacterium]
MNRLVWLAGWRALFAQPGLTLLAMLGVALGVATTTAVDLANQGVLRAMRLSVESAAGKATHRLTAPPPGIDEHDYAAWRLRPDAPPAAPIVEGTVFALAPDGGNNPSAPPISGSPDAPTPEKGHPRTPLTLLGIDPLAEGALRPRLEIPTGGDLLTTLLTRPDTALLHEETARKLRIKPGDTLTILANGRERNLVIPGVITSSDPLARQALAATLLTDIATAQELLGMRGWLSRIDALLPENAPPPVALPAGVNLAPANERIEILENLTRSFRANLSALSLLALLVGTFIIHNAMAFSVVRQRRLIGLLRAMGVTRGEILRQTLLDGLLIGLPGTLFGLLLGIALGDTLLQLMARTIDDLYYRMRVVELVIEPSSLIKGLILGIGATLIASWLPAREAASTAVIDALSRSRLEQQRRTRAPRLALFGALLILAGWGATLWPTARLEAGMLAMGLITVGCALLAPWFTIGLMERLRPLLTRVAGLHGALACGGVIRGASRTGMAVAALTVATAM